MRLRRGARTTLLVIGLGLCGGLIGAGLTTLILRTVLGPRVAPPALTVPQEIKSRPHVTLFSDGNFIVTGEVDVVYVPQPRPGFSASGGPIDPDTAARWHRLALTEHRHEAMRELERVYWANLVREGLAVRSEHLPAGQIP